MKRQPKTIGQRVLPSGSIQVFFNLHGFVSQTFPASSTVGERNAWRDREMEKRGGGALEAGSIAADVVRFLAKPEIAAMPTVATYARILALWVAALGPHRRRHGIERDDIERVLQGWLKTLSPVTVYHRRTPLLRLWTVLDGVDAPNPVKHTTRPDHHRPFDKAVPFATLTAIVDTMPATKRIAKGIDRPSLAKLRAAVILATGIPPGELLKLKPHHVDLAGATVRMPWRDKGEGTPAHTRELSPEGVTAFAALLAADGMAGPFGKHAAANLSRCVKRAVRRVQGPQAATSTYWMRHSLGTELYRHRGDLATVGRLLGHVEGSPVTARYALGAHAHVDRAALAAVSAARAAAVQGGSPCDQRTTDHRRKRTSTRASAMPSSERVSSGRSSKTLKRRSAN